MFASPPKLVAHPAFGELAMAADRGMETIAGFAEDLDVAGRQWDLVILCQTIDHLLDVSATLATLRTAVAQDGRAFVDVLDVALAMRRLGRVEEAVKIDHPFYLTAPTARAYFARAGLAVAAERLSGDGHRGFLLAPAEATMTIQHDGRTYRLRRKDPLVVTRGGGYFLYPGIGALRAIATRSYAGQEDRLPA
jgi:hypothetical protein